LVKTHDSQRAVADPRRAFPQIEDQEVRRTEARRKSVYDDFVDNIA
jgi:hypothetical protein